VQVVTGISSVLGKVAAAQHTAVVMSDGTVRVCGDNTYGQLGINVNGGSRLTPVTVLNITSATAVACGGGFSAVLLADGTVGTFGRNLAGGLGVNDTTSRQTPVQVWGISSSAIAVAGGDHHTAVLLADGTVRTFGFNGNGQLGVNDTTSRLTPVTVLNISTATAVACGGTHTIVLLSNGTVRTFGSNDGGELGVNDITQRLTPVQVLNITSGTAVSASQTNHTAVLLADGTVRTFGLNSSGELGVNESGATSSRLTPVQVFGISSSAVAVACGRRGTTILLADGTIRNMGNNVGGQIGVGDTTQRNTPVTVQNISTATAIACGYYQTSILLADGTLRTVGLNSSGQLGVADTVNRLIPVKVGVSGNKVGAGFYFTAVVSNDGTLRTFGSNQFGQLGINVSGGTRQTPVQVTGLTSAIATAGGAVFTAVLLADGTVRTFGRNNNGQLGVNDNTDRLTPVTVVNISTATAVACGSDHAAVLLANGTVRTFGYNINGGQLGIDVSGGTRQTPVQVFAISSSAVAVECGGSHTTVLLADGTVRTFGDNTYGQLGINVSGGSRQTPVQVFGISSSATSVSCGYNHTAVLLANGTVRTFGYNVFGQLGVNDTTSRQTPVQVFGISSSAVAVACGLQHTSVLLADGTVRTFGRNNTGQLGIDVTGGTRQTPVQVFGISSSAVAIANGGLAYLTALLLTDGSVRTFGQNDYGQLGINITGGSRQTPVTVLNISTATAIVTPLSSAVTPAPTAFLTSAATSITLAATGGQIWTSSATGVARTTSVSVSGGEYHTAVLLKDGTVRTFGLNTNGQLGVNDTTSRLTPVQVTGLSTATAVASTGYNTIVILSDGTVRTFGRNTYGNLGVNDTISRLTPVQVWGISSSATAVAGGDSHTAVVLTDGTVRTFGRNDFGQLGLNDTTSRLTPVQVFGISSSATAVACGSSHTAILLANGTVRTCGENSFGQLGVNDTTNRSTPVQVWGISSSAVAVAVGGVYTAVLLADGTVRTFGANAQGQLGVNDTTSRLTPVQVWGISSSAVAVACGGFYAAVLLTDGTVRTFGFNNRGQIGVNDTTQRNTPVQVWGISSSATAIACGFNHTIVLLADSTVRTFGNNINGGLGTNDTTSRLTPVAVFGILGTFPYPTYVTAKGLALGLSAPTFQLDLSTDKARKLATTTWTTGSDRRIKSDIQTANLTRCVDIVDSLDLKYFKWDIPGVQGGQSPTDTHSLGWIAQDVKEFFPNSVRLTQDYGFDDFHNLDSDQLIKTMYGALKKMCEDTYGQ
jgi:alpha-tubulin suppressor-like RCC1 family protein